MGGRACFPLDKICYLPTCFPRRGHIMDNLIFNHRFESTSAIFKYFSFVGLSVSNPFKTHFAFLSKTIKNWLLMLQMYIYPGEIAQVASHDERLFWGLFHSNLILFKN